MKTYFLLKNMNLNAYTNFNGYILENLLHEYKF